MGKTIRTNLCWLALWSAGHLQWLKSSVSVSVKTSLFDKQTFALLYGYSAEQIDIQVLYMHSSQGFLTGYIRYLIIRFFPHKSLDSAGNVDWGLYSWNLSDKLVNHLFLPFPLYVLWWKTLKNSHLLVSAFYYRWGWPARSNHMTKTRRPNILAYSVTVEFCLVEQTSWPEQLVLILAFCYSWTWPASLCWRGWMPVSITVLRFSFLSSAARLQCRLGRRGCLPVRIPSTREEGERDCQSHFSIGSHRWVDGYYEWKGQVLWVGHMRWNWKGKE